MEEERRLLGDPLQGGARRGKIDSDMYPRATGGFEIPMNYSNSHRRAAQEPRRFVEVFETCEIYEPAAT